MIHDNDRFKTHCGFMNCSECETCIYDEEIKDYTKEKIKSCYLCTNLIKSSLGEDSVRFKASCNGSLVRRNGFSVPRVIKECTGPMIEIVPPKWCPKNRGVTKEYIPNDELENDEKPTLLLPVITNNKPKIISHTEKREMLKALKPITDWDDIKEGELYVVPKIFAQKRKIVKVVLKTDNILRCSEINDNGEESVMLTSIFQNDLDLVLITRLLKF